MRILQLELNHRFAENPHLAVSLLPFDTFCCLPWQKNKLLYPCSLKFPNSLRTRFSRCLGLLYHLAVIGVSGREYIFNFCICSLICCGYPQHSRPDCRASPPILAACPAISGRTYIYIHSYQFPCSSITIFDSVRWLICPILSCRGYTNTVASRMAAPSLAPFRNRLRSLPHLCREYIFFPVSFCICSC